MRGLYGEGGVKNEVLMGGGGRAVCSDSLC